MIKTLLTAAAVSLAGFMGSAHAATLSGLFNVTAVNVTNVSRTQSEATLDNFQAALDGNLGGNTSSYTSATFTYDGAIAFDTRVGSSTTIEDWLKSGGGVLGGFDANFPDFLDLQQSKGNIDGNPPSATTTFYLFESVLDVAGGPNAKVTHDDGFAIFRDDVPFAEFLGPTVVRDTTLPLAFERGSFALLYVATNSDPSVLKVEGLAPVPLPAPVALLAAGLAGLGALRLRRKAA